ncbi:SWI/SNF-related matrix-associated actin-dependent regulator of chromatin subfamily A containing DEAD/H box 1 homolog [Anopheles ziemanni]|uniref:SWI/SNF-related matrix-associated actin-dependent regulator of chromatin subfamily A containing DEAD/H box 1 homolog n=1 Tax=Anopheles coustani TaxID=139045 RepID=UPI00265B1ED8|nr:SWI/SNF-related matrix-associated actin-dependent regulator of chromatin subfamily A containing DEAD/H box 1 homolog [Anopheles coustani]XP_058168767.1 SWI/SNF-related matrix-associated actin-dependent regulator of chromatin subfamily A containing DEAD/H box 1 homolog [Anopheles ziemanni]
MSLREYRKPLQNGNGEGNGGDSKLSLAPGRRRIQMMGDSDSEGDATGSPSKPSAAIVPAVEVKEKPKEVTPQPLTIKEKEARLQTIRRSCLDVDAMLVQSTLAGNDWDVEKTIEQLKAAPKRKILVSPSPSKVATKTFPTNGHTNNQPAKKRRVQESNNGSDNESDIDSDRPAEQVFDSDEDSDGHGGYSYGKLTKERKGVLEFLNAAPLTELISVKTLTQKKIDFLLELRPFKDWSDLVNKLRSHKSLQTDLLNNTQEYLTRRNNVAAIMGKCGKIVKKLEDAIESGTNLVEQPESIADGLKLAEYQLVGLNWMTIMHRHNMNGILADEMGLGKTIQIIAFIAWLKENGEQTRPNLVVVPSSTMDNWEQELVKWCPNLVILKYYGNQADRRMIRVDWAKNGIDDIDVVLTTYHMMGASGEEKKMWRVTQFDYVVFDEAHMLKNVHSQRYQNLIRINAKHRILLTGTPLQNNLLELMSLLCFVMPKLFGSKVEDIKALFQGKVKTAKGETDEEVSSFEKDQIERAKKIMKPFILRRLKRDVLSFLPPKKEIVLKTPMIDSQREKYNETVNEYQQATGVIKENTEVSGMAIMMDLRKLANHPLLLRYYYSDADVRDIARKLATDVDYKGNNVDDIFLDIAYLSDFKLFQLKEKYTNLYDLCLPEKLITASGKFRQLDELLPKLKEGGHRVLIFSQFTMMLDIMERYMKIRKYGFLRLDGATAVTDRQELIDQYTQDPDLFIFLLSTKAGGLGINLTAADTVIIHDIDFNPYNDKQAEDRAHRMGQKKPVTIYKLVSEGTIEEGMLTIAQQKLQLEKDVTDQDANNPVNDHKCMVGLLTMALNMDESKADSLLKNESPRKKSLEEDF